MIGPMLYAPDAAQMCQFEFTCTCVKDLHGILGHQGFRCVRAMRRSLCSNIFQTPMLTTGELFTMLDALFFAMFDSRKACQQFTWCEDSVLSHAVCWMGCNGVHKRLAANARAALTIHYPFRHSCFWSALPWQFHNTWRTGQSLFISWPALATFSEGIKRQSSGRLQRTSHPFVEDAERSECSCREGLKKPTKKATDLVLYWLLMNTIEY